MISGLPKSSAVSAEAGIIANKAPFDRLRVTPNSSKGNQNDR